MKSFISDRSNNIQSNLASNGVICWPNSISNIDKENKTIQLSPNPVIDILDIVSETPINNIQVLDMLGKIILNREGLQSYSEQLDFKEFPTGIYIIQVNKIHNYRILK